MAGTAAGRAIRGREVGILALATVGVLVAELFGTGAASLWYDEAATYSGAARSYESLWSMVADVDLVHGAFYALMHPIVALSGPDAFAMRAVSGVAVATTACVLYLLARTWGSPVSAAATSVIFLGLARTSWMATEARSFALATLLATVLALLFVRGLRSAHTGWAIAYAGVALAAVHIFVLLALVVLAHLLSLALVRRDGTRLWPLAVAQAGTLVIALPFAGLVAAQRAQLGGTFEIGTRTWSHVFIGEFFHRQVVQASVIWAILVACVVVLAAQSWKNRQSSRRFSGARGARATGPPSILAVTVPWLVLPTVAVIAFSVASPTIYQPRALVTSAPALCLLLAEAARRAFGSHIALGVAAVVLLLGIPAYVANRELTAKGSDWPLASAYLAGQSEPREVVVYSTPVDYHSWPSLMRIVHPTRVAALSDIALIEPFEDRAALFDERRNISDLDTRLSAAETVWYVRAAALSEGEFGPDVAALHRAGLTRHTSWTGPRTIIEEWRRDDTP